MYRDFDAQQIGAERIQNQPIQVVLCLQLKVDVKSYFFAICFENFNS